MLDINQNTKVNEVFEAMILKQSNIVVHVSKECIEYDYARMCKKLDKAKKADARKRNRYNEKNIEAIIKYLEDLKGRVDENNCLTISWGVESGKHAESSPVRMITTDEYDIRACNYVELLNENVVEFKFEHMADIMAYELAYRDFGDNMEDMEKLLYNCTLVAPVDNQILFEHFENFGVKPYEECTKFLLASESPYIDNENNVLRSYFLNYEEKIRDRRRSKVRYRKVINDSMHQAMTIFAGYMLHRCMGARLKADMIYVGNTSVIFRVDFNNIAEFTSMMDGVTIRAFGRMFKADPSISVY